MEGNFKAGNERYHDDKEFHDPVVRCDKCHKILLLETVKSLGMCQYCGHRKVKKVSVFNEEELATIQKWGVDPDWLALFGPVAGVANA